MKLGKVLFTAFSACLLAVAGAYAMMQAMPAYEVEFSSLTGSCKRVTYKGDVIPGGCRMVKQGKIQHYEAVHGY